MDDIERGPITTTYAISLSAPSSPNPDSKRLSQLETFQILIGDVDAPPSPTATPPEDLYHQVILAERSARNAYYISGFFFFLMVFLQIVFCLTITVGAKTFDRTYISILAAVNTVVASIIGVLKGLGLPDKKGLERVKLQRIIDRIELTTRKLKAGMEVDATQQATDLKECYETAQDAAEVILKDAFGSKK